jgi:phage/plasmid-like protein (TIGR03299 family)
MSANLFNGRYFGRAAAWHQMGIVMDEPKTATEAIAIARLDYKVLKAEAFFRTDNPAFDMLDLESTEPRYLEHAMADQVAIYREPTLDDPVVRDFGVAGKKFTIVQNADLARILDPMTREWPVETAGALGSGETVWFLLDMGEGTIAGEAHRRFAWVRNSHLPGQSLMFKPVRTRVVCANTDAVAMNEQGVQIALRHTADIQVRFEQVIRAMDQLRAQNAIDEAALEALAEYAMSSQDEEAIAEKLYPFPKEPKHRTLNGMAPEVLARFERMNEAMDHSYELNLERMKKYRSQYQEVHETLAIQHPRIAMTAYGAYQACLEAEQYRRNTAANAVSAFFGQGYKIQAQAKASLLALTK